MSAPSRRVLFLLLVVVLLMPAATVAQEEESPREKRRILFEGTHVLRRILYDHGFTALETIGAAEDDPERTLVVALGDLDVLGKLPRGLESFVRRGGAVLLASDRAIEDARVLREVIGVTGVSINREKMVCPQLSNCYNQHAFCPRVLYVSGAHPPLFQQTRGSGGGDLLVATNLPSKLRVRRELPGRVQPLATLPPGTQVDAPRARPEEQFPLFSVGGVVGSGQVLVLADHSVFINQMMMPLDTGNVEFSYKAVRWLQGEYGQRNQVVFLEEGKIQTKLDIPLKSTAIPPDEAMRFIFSRRNQILAEAENYLVQLEKDDAFNRKLRQILNELGLPPYTLVRMLVVVGTSILILYLLYRLGIRGRFRHDTSVPLLASTLGRNLPTAPLMEQRNQALLRVGNLAEPASGLVRRWFARLGVEVERATPPVFEVQGGWWHRRWLRGRLGRLWRLAVGSGTIHLSAGEFWRLEQELKGLRGSWERGEWRVA